MSDPERLIDTRDGLARSLLAAGREDAPGSASMQRALATVSVAAAATAVSGTGSAAATATTGFWLKWLGIGATGGMLTMGAVQAVRPIVSQPEVPVATSAPRAVTPSRQSARTAQVPSDPEPVVVAVPPKEPTTPSSRASASAPNGQPTRGAAGPTSLSQELARIDAARGRLSAGDPAGALAVLDRYARDYPRGRFGQEALLVRIEAHIAQGNCGQARSLGRGFLERHAKSALGQRVRSLLARCGQAN